MGTVARREDAERVTTATKARDVAVFGIVQGVGFRPFVYRLAIELGLHGWVRNTSGEVEIHVEGRAKALDAFERRLLAEAPALAQIERLTSRSGIVEGGVEFRIDASAREEGRFQPVSPDVATCPDCLAEVRSATDRRAGYAFTNCTNCGPRFTIIEDIPYDRALTTMRAFPMCPACRAEYDDPADRRFHAQPTACPDCGPHLWIEEGGSRLADDDAAAIARAAALLREGRVLAVKGLGGFHLAVDARSDDAVSLLRRRKRRPARALAVMMPSLEQARRYCGVDEVAEAALTATAAPIVLLPLSSEPAARLSPLLAPDHDTVGVMLPYTPLHHLLLARFGGPLVMTSGNLSEEPLAVDNDEARTRLGGIADAFLMHDRPIHIPCDDSVVAIAPAPAGKRLTGVRRARGYAPAPVRLTPSGPVVLAVGPELKSTVCLAREDLAFLSQHIGDLGNLETWEHYRRVARHMERLFRATPAVIAHDLHPDYMSTAYARERSGAEGLALVPVQHHHAHALSCLAEAGIDPRLVPVQAVVLDGTGYGADGRVWGGEWLLLDGAGYRRTAHLGYLPLVGGEGAIHHVDRLAAGYLLGSGRDSLARELPSLAHLGADGLALLGAGLDAPATVQTSSMGRLFDAVSGILGVTREATYEAQAAIRLETVARSLPTAPPYRWQRDAAGEVDAVGVLEQIALASLAGEPVAVSARRFHETIAEVVGELCEERAVQAGAWTVALSGGCFQNLLLLELCLRELQRRGLKPITHGLVPCNDGGVSLGQALGARLAVAAG